MGARFIIQSAQRWSLNLQRGHSPQEILLIEMIRLPTTNLRNRKKSLPIKNSRPGKKKEQPFSGKR